MGHNYRKKFFVIMLLFGSFIWRSAPVKAAESDSVSGSDPIVEEYVNVDISDMVYKAGGWGTPIRKEENAIAMFAISARDRLKADIFMALQEEARYLDISSYQMTSEDALDLQIIYAEVLNENPELFYVNSNYFSYSTGYRNNCYCINYLYFRYVVHTEAEKTVYMDALRKAAAEVKEGMLEEEKALALHDYLAQHCAYAYEEYLDGTLSSTAHVYDAYGALVLGKAVCQGYAEAYNALCHYVGISSRVISSDSMGHAWNVIYIDDSWYHVDVTWDDPVWNREGRAMHKYFLLSDTEMENRKHYGWTTAVDCTSTKYDAIDYWWNSTESGIVFGDKQYFIRGKEYGGFELVEKNSDSFSIVYSSNLRWEVWEDTEGTYYVGGFSYLSQQGDYIYFNDKLNLYAMKLTESTPKIIYTYTDGEGYICGAMVYEDGTARLNIFTAPDMESDDYIEVLLKMEEPNVAPDYTSRTLSTTTAMEYSIDDGITYQSCTDNMTFEQFGWDGKREKSVLIRMAACDGKIASDPIGIEIVPRQDIAWGTITVSGKEDQQVTLRLLKDGENVTELALDNSEYMLELETGSYTLEVSSLNCVTRTYSVTKEEGQVIENIELHLFGDVSGDGIINSKDKKLIFNHIAGISLLTDYDVLVGDVSGDGRINSKDKKMMFNHIAGTSRLW